MKKLNNFLDLKCHLGVDLHIEKVIKSIPECKLLRDWQ